jgi:hypothetical protein
MSYSSGGLIQATDYNALVGTSPSSTANTINTVWAVGNGRYGYGQTAIAQVSSGNMVTATQWATAINTLNNIYAHQSNTSSGLTAPTAGGVITYLSTFQSGINTAYTNGYNVYSTSTTTGSNFTNTWTATNQLTAVSNNFSRTVTFASGDAARYFFNMGGKLSFYVSATNNDGTSRSGDIVTLAGTNLGGFINFAGGSNGGRSGSGGTLVTNATGLGYYNMTTSQQTGVYITSSTSGYTSDYIYLYLNSNGTQGSNADAGSVLTFNLSLYSAARSGSIPFNDTVNVTFTTRVDIIAPNLTYGGLSNTYGTITIA